MEVKIFTKQLSNSCGYENNTDIEEKQTAETNALTEKVNASLKGIPKERILSRETKQTTAACDGVAFTQVTIIIWIDDGS